jgi:hypothetical protein
MTAGFQGEGHDTTWRAKKGSKETKVSLCTQYPTPNLSYTLYNLFRLDAEGDNRCLIEPAKQAVTITRWTMRVVHTWRTQKQAGTSWQTAVVESRGLFLISWDVVGRQSFLPTCPPRHKY